MRFCYNCMQQIEEGDFTTCPYCKKSLNPDYDARRFLKPGTILQEKYITGKKIGAGGFGNTYIGWDKLLQRKVAIKEYFPIRLSSRSEESQIVAVSGGEEGLRHFNTGLQDFIEEARNIAGMQEIRGVVQVYNFFEENGTGYIIMEFLEGKDVKEILNQRGERMDYEWSRKVILTVLHTLREIHKRGILHRDIAPDNVFITNEGVIKLIDFGAAKSMANMEDMQGDIILKMGYAPIEQYGRNTTQGQYTDLYALAAMFYKMLTGAKPQAANERMRKDELKAPSDLGIEIPEQAELAIMVCLNLQPQFRLQSAQEFMDALDGGDFQPVYEPEWILPEIEEIDSKGFGDIIGGMKKWQKAVIAVAFFVIVITATGVVVNFANNKKAEGTELVHKGDIHLPQCEEKTEEDAINSLDELGISTNVTYSYNEGCPENKVVAMKPAAGSQADKGDIVALIVESPSLVTIPDYTGKKEDEAKAGLKELLGNKYNDGIISYNYTSSDSEKGKCYGQTSSDVVNISDIGSFKVNVSWGTKESYEIKMPDIGNKTIEQAKKLIDSNGMDMDIEKTKEVYKDNVAAGRIITQSIKSGKKFNNNKADIKGYSVPEKVKITISKGPKPTPTPKPTPEPTPRPTVKPTQKPAPKPEPARTPTPKRQDDDDGWISWSKKPTKKPIVIQ